jgi:transposase-like protein
MKNQPKYDPTNDPSSPAYIPKVECPYCHSTNVTRISNTERVASIAMLGIFSKKINKNFKCNSCKATF